MVSPVIAEDGKLAGQRGDASWRRGPRTGFQNEAEGFSSSDEGPLGLGSESESEDLEMSAYPHMPGGPWRTTNEEVGGRVKTRNEIGLSLRGGEGPSLGDRLIMADGGRPVVSSEEKKIADLKVIRSLVINVLLIGLWYNISPSQPNCSRC
jgi:solute carrier family 35 protein C2